ncbi:unnamed protein product [Rotaria socialis]|uniref:C2 domain-containing protein n=1 Tax=Rotaria socialis TaxID=392032 RepID=A0A817U029_9BILA|nr:unnamed protein product [Rotaria socialis]
MSMNRQAIIDAFIERHRANFNDLIDHLTLYYNKTRLHFTSLSEKTNQRYLYLSILATFILLTIIFLIIFEYRRLLQCIQKFFKLVYSYKQYILIRIRNKYLQKRTPSLLNALLNSKSHIREKFYNEFARSLNEELKNRKEQLSVETLQFANAKIRDVSQTANNSNGETPAEKIVINAVLDIDHLILNIVNKFKEQHFSLETPKLSGQLNVLLIINPTQYTIEANLQQLHINPVNIIDPNNNLSANETQSIVKVLDETINRTTVRCSFRLSDNQEDKHHVSLYNSALGSYPDSKQPHSSINQLSSSSIQTAGSRTRESATTRYQLSDPLPTVLINDSNRYIFTKDPALEKEPKRLLIRVVKAVKLHDVEQPYCILELNYPKQIKQTDIAKNGLNPFWDERFIFECNEQSNLIRLQIIDHKKSKKRNNNDYTDTVYADLSIPFSYEMSTVYKQDIQISQQYPESIIRLENMQRQQSSHLPTLQAIKSNSCSDITGLKDFSTNMLQQPSLDNHRLEENENSDRFDHVPLSPLGPRLAVVNTKHTATAIKPMVSTGFTVQSPAHPTDFTVQAPVHPTSFTVQSPAHPTDFTVQPPVHPTSFTVRPPVHPTECSSLLFETTLANATRKPQELRSPSYKKSTSLDISFSSSKHVAPPLQSLISENSFSTLSEEEALTANNGYDVESIDDSQIWTYNERDINKIEQSYPQRYQQSPSHDFLSSPYETSTLPKNYGLSTSLYDDNPDYLSTIPRSSDIGPSTNTFSPYSPLSIRDGNQEYEKPQKSKSFMNSLKHLTLPRRKNRNKDKHNTSMNSNTSSITQLNNSVQTPSTNPVAHSFSSEYFLAHPTDVRPIRRSRSISQSFKNLFRSNSKKKAHAAKTDALEEYENGTHNYIVDNSNFLSTSTPTQKKLSFLHRRKSKQKNKEQAHYSANSLSSFDCSRMESVRDTPVRANVGHPVTMTKSFAQ